MPKHVAVLMGGWSSERPISLSSGNACVKALEGEGYRVTPVDVGPDVATAMTQLKPDVALNALHGPAGEDGTIQGLLEILKIPYTHSGVLASALAMHKERAKTVMHAAGVAVPQGCVVNRFVAAKSHPLPPPYVVKPIAEGSSMGVIIVREERSHPPQILASDEWTYGEEVLAETYIAGRELTCAVMGDKALGVIEIKPASGEWYDFDAKYAEGGSIHVLPAEIKPNVYQRVQELSLTAHQALGCRGVSRADLRYDDTPGGTGALVVLEVNTQPGMTPTSLVPEMAAHAGLSFGELVRWMVEDASLGR
ncbi:D-alanine--D-alanine ligase [Methylobacterium brachythecii]|uniref:D-alanine--D-alanine ligase n=1 Tax=Methylobacterium brachythecii TaxID=1176177 RepID=A0A7W6F8E0_9HYPH|nr:D-alanine--D-alanine ligase [Methylobacterium brachythecii]MBB3904339.1 D-alanine-D-alanine ligase [Methylobacterium brachythecii]GLS46535.1 D-alanine--D-alanine ligase [Methylobacterium brachythecii]